jgi:Mg/Co/Ni transporter MgtE
MMRTEAPFVPAAMAVDEALSFVRANGGVATLVGTPDDLIGVVTLDRLVAASQDGRTSDPVGSLAEDPLVHVHPDHPFDVVVERFAQSSGVLPVVSRVQARRVEGVVTIDEVARFVERRRTERRSDDDAEGV